MNKPWSHLKASEEKSDFFNLIGADITFDKEIVGIGGRILYQKGDKAYISDVIYNAGHSYRPIPDIWIKPEIVLFQINNIVGHWRPETFLEFKPAQP